MSDLPDWVLNAIKDLPPLSTESETATLFRVHKKTLYRWRESGKIRGVKADPDGSGHWLYPRLEIARCLVRMREGGPLSA